MGGGIWTKFCNRRMTMSENDIPGFIGLVVGVLVMLGMCWYFFGLPVTRCGDCGRWKPFWKTKSIELGYGAFTIVCKDKLECRLVHSDMLNDKG